MPYCLGMRILSAGAVFVAALALSSCAMPTVKANYADPVELGEACESAVVTALAAEEALRASHPAWVNDPPDAGPGTPEGDQWAAWVEDEQAQWDAIMTPVYQTCSSPGEWFLAAKKHPALMGFTDAEFITPDMLEGWCHKDPALAACTGYEEWLATMG